MRIFLCILLLVSMFCACAPVAANAASEHEPDAGARGYRHTTVFAVQENGLVTETQKQLPWQSGMESYALSFVLNDPSVQYTVKRSGGHVNVDISGFPTFPSQSTEEAAIAGIVNTLFTFSDVDKVALTFQGEPVDTLPHGTQANAVFTEAIPIDAKD